MKCNLFIEHLKECECIRRSLTPRKPIDVKIECFSCKHYQPYNPKMPADLFKKDGDCILDPLSPKEKAYTDICIWWEFRGYTSSP